jgi:hypothetical protein
MLQDSDSNCRQLKNKGQLTADPAQLAALASTRQHWTDSFNAMAKQQQLGAHRCAGYPAVYHRCC